MNRTVPFLAAFRETGSVLKASIAAGIHRSAHYRRLREDTDYRQAFDAALAYVEAFRASTAIDRAREEEARTQELEDAVWDRALNGWEEPLTYQGQLSYRPKFDENGVAVLNENGAPVFTVTTIRKFSVDREQFMLRGARPERWRERFEVTGKGGAAIESSITVTFVKPE